jgi:hypothetical protein
MTRYIDADALKESVHAHDYVLKDCLNSTDKGMFTVGIMQAIDEQPTIDAVPHWIPCSERLPEDSGDYLVRPSDSVLEDYSDFSEIMIMPYDADCEAFGWWVERYHPISLGYLDSDFNEFEVIAWMPMPKPYEEKGEADG